MKLRYRLTIIIAVMSVTMITILSIILLSRARILQTNVAFESLENLAQSETYFMQQQFAMNMDTIDALAKVFSSFQNVPMEQRRPLFDTMLRSIPESSQDIIGVYHVWRLGVIDNGPPIYSTLYTSEHSTATEEIIVGYEFNIWNPPEYTRCMQSIVDNEAWQWILPVPVPFVNRGRETHVSFITAPIIGNQTGELYGFVGSGIDLSDIQERIRNLTPYETGRALVISNAGIIVAHPNPSIIGEDFTESGLATAGRAGLDLIYDTLENGNVHHILHNGNIVIVTPFHIGTTRGNWAVIMVVEESQVLKEVNQLRTFAISLALIMVLIVIGIVFVIVSRSVKPIVAIADELKEISEGEGDLTRQIVVTSNDEVGLLARYFNLTIEKIKIMVRHVKNETRTINDMSTELANDMTETAATMNEITANINSIKGRMLSQSASVTETNATMEQITVNINKLNGHVERQTESVSQSSTAIEQMLANIQSVTQTLVKNVDNVEKLSDASELGRSGLSEVATDIQEISRESEGLLEINSVMEGIASQTNLLSMNAAIEAAHAGDAGKGFAVVADEIRKLAENSSEQSKTISTVLKKIKSSIDKIMESTDNVLKRFEAIDLGVRTVAEQEENIRNSMEEQSQGSKQILEAISLLNEITQQVKGGSMEMLEGAKEVMQEADSLEKSTQEITGGMNEMASGVDQVNVAVSNINDLTNRNRETASLLMREVGKFKIE
ncbi:MAG: methyl-accepting chemotaxis protein [Treponema sp.]|nr:methyl-accepting chemotaxis protein [Treponema sp.]